MHTAEPFLSYDLPDELIAVRPIGKGGKRAQARLLHAKSVVDGQDAAQCVSNCVSNCISHRTFADIPELLRSGDVLVLNNSRVVPSRFIVRKIDSKIQGNESRGVEIFLLRPADAEQRETARGMSRFVEAGVATGDSEVWEAIGKPRKSLATGETFISGDLVFEVAAVYADYFIVSIFSIAADSVAELRERQGLMPIPPYIRRGLADDQDREDYQNVFAQQNGSIAAPTAGLHFTSDLLVELERRGVEVCFVTLHVGSYSFSPLRDASYHNHKVAKEEYCLTREVIEKIRQAKLQQRRVIAVGTTVVRVLESLAGYVMGQVESFIDTGANSRSGSCLDLNMAHRSEDICGDNSDSNTDSDIDSNTGGNDPDDLRPHPVGSGELRGWTEIFIVPGYQFRVVDALITNFHQPFSTHLLLVSAFWGSRRVSAIYAEAVRERYRFLSYGDGMFLEP